jgi:serine/threonine-protein kinase RsbW
MATAPHVRLSLPNRPENVLVVRQALSGVAARLGLDAIETNDLNTAVTEACNNVAMHAYEGEEGPLEVDVDVLDGALAVLVRDHGVGIETHMRAGGASSEQPGAPGGMGLAVIDALAGRAEFTEPASGGTEVRMEFPTPDGSTLPPVHENGGAGDVGTAVPGSSAVALSVASGALAQAVLPRVLSALAARAHFTTDRISDVQLVADVLAANAGDSLGGGRLTVGVSVAPRVLDLRFGPFDAGRGESMLAAAADGLASVIERLTDSTRIAPAGSGRSETLELRLVDRR